MLSVQFLRGFAVFAIIPLNLLGQKVTASMKAEMAGTSLSRDVSTDLGSAREVFGHMLRSMLRPGGMAVVSDCGESSRSPFYFPAGSSTVAVLDLFTVTYPAYDWSIQSGVVNVLPKEHDLPVLDLKIGVFEWNTSESVHLNVHRVFELSVVKVRLAQLGIIPALEGGIGLQRPPRVRDGVPEPPPKGRTLRLENATVLSALNAVAASYGTAVWWYEESSCGSKRTYRYTVN